MCVSAIIIIRIFQETSLKMKLVNLSIFCPFFELVMHRCTCVWHSCPFTGVWFYWLGILLVLYSFCYHVPSNLSPYTLSFLHFFSYLKHILLSSSTYNICNWNEFVPSVHVLHLLHNIVISCEIVTIWICGISIAECSTCSQWT